MKPRQAGFEGSFGEQSRITKGLGPVLSGLIAAALVVLTLLVAVILGSQEQVLVAGVVSTATDTATPVPDTPSPLPTVVPPTPSIVPSPTSPPSPTPTITPSPSPLPTETPEPTMVSGCPIPADWQKHTVRGGETLPLLAWRFWTTEYRLMQGNCLSSRNLRPGQIIYVPDVDPRQSCPRPPGWVAYTVQRGDTLYALATRAGISVDRLKEANCLMGDRIYAGATLWVPFALPTPTGRPSNTPVPTNTPTPVETETSPTPTITPTPTGSGTPGPTATDTATPGPTSDTATPGTQTVEPTDTAIPPTETPGPTTDTPVPPTDTPLPTDTPVPPTDTPVPPVETPLPTKTPVPPTDTPVPPTATGTV